MSQAILRARTELETLRNHAGRLPGTSANPNAIDTVQIRYGDWHCSAQTRNLRFKRQIHSLSIDRVNPLFEIAMISNQQVNFRSDPRTYRNAFESIVQVDGRMSNFSG